MSDVTVETTSLRAAAYLAARGATLSLVREAVTLPAGLPELCFTFSGEAAEDLYRGYLAHDFAVAAEDLRAFLAALGDKLLAREVVR